MSYIRIGSPQHKLRTTSIKVHNNAKIVFFTNQTLLINDWKNLSDIEYQIEKQGLTNYSILDDVVKKVNVKGMLYPNLSKGEGVGIVETIIALTFNGDVRSINLEDSHFSILVDYLNTVTAYFFRYDQTKVFKFNEDTNTTYMEAVMSKIPHYHEPIIYIKNN